MRGAWILAANHISHFDPLLITATVPRKIDWMAMADLFRGRLLGAWLRASDCFPVVRFKPDRAALRTAIVRLEAGHAVGMFPEGGLRDGAASVLGGAPLLRGIRAVAQMAHAPLVPCVILGSDRLYQREELVATCAACRSGSASASRSRLTQRAAISRHGWASRSARSPRRTPRIFTARTPISPNPRASGCAAHELHQIHRQPQRLGDVHDDVGAPAASPFAAGQPQGTGARYIAEHAGIPRQEYFYATSMIEADYSPRPPPADSHALGFADLDEASRKQSGACRLLFGRGRSIRADRADASRADVRERFRLPALGGGLQCRARLECLLYPPSLPLLPSPHRQTGMASSPSQAIACAPRGKGSGRAFAELRQLMRVLRAEGCKEFGLWATSYGGWIGALLASVERDFRFLTLMAPIVDVTHAIWESPAAWALRPELVRHGIERELIAQHYSHVSPLHAPPLDPGDRALLISGEYDHVAPAHTIARLHAAWPGSRLQTVLQGHFGYRMMRAAWSEFIASGALQ